MVSTHGNARACDRRWNVEATFPSSITTVPARWQYDADKGVQNSAIGFSRDGRQWSNPRIIETGVGAMPQLVEQGEKIIVFNTGYPDGVAVTRHVIDIDTWRR